MTDKPKLVFFPSMNRVPAASSPNETDFEREQRERKNTHIALDEQRRKEVEQRKRRIQIAMCSLPLKQGAELQIPSLVHALESTFNAVQAEIPVANPTIIEEQLAKAADFAEQFATHLEHMETAATRALVRAMDGDVVRLVDLQWQLNEFSQRANLARGEYLAFDAPPEYLVKRSAKRGAKVKKLPDAMMETTAYCYKLLTGTLPNKGTNRGSFHEFLTRVLKAYGIKANPRHLMDKLTK